mmetsp:Transcript_15563/g.25480  ORF Transcript_15563/g.25480 Transcript_15563/m.25480 type:complete len:378 (-) Transcript_15563:2399-3532(-)|eukprot:CAMPEP_0203774730 /NCGR_PEP_ID=MMETSP0099_2-20121227/5549_1 /ASSEMBLY_ACC=CAM_ASM_000209 /TAXON_ID=96639 /ORGANISM=" , Strain NY0313808BC1" /LENGTH=377 /DNA_ID=CAMNT_0050673051 /DNA_START=2880 /DNA_END=4013 /DNA_ORIENTATION=+
MGEMGNCGDPEEKAHFEQVLKSFVDYECDMLGEVARRERNVLKGNSGIVEYLPGGKEGFRTKIEGLKRCVLGNQRLFKGLLDGNGFTAQYSAQLKVDISTEIRNLSKARSTLHQCAREWSEEGRAEREKCFGPLLDYLEKYVSSGADKKVLVPGAGLGRLCAEVVGRGYSCQGNEFSYHMLLMSSYILNELASSQPEEQVVIHPWIHNPSNHKTVNDMTRPVHIPDVSAVEMIGPNNNAEMSMCAGEFLSCYSSQKNEWDAIMTCFFIDTAPNILAYLKVIFAALKPGGVWINGGPLLWHWQSNSPKSYTAGKTMQADDSRYDDSIELSYDEVRSIAQGVGFEFKEERWEEVSYTNDSLSMLQSRYQVVQTVAVKPA